MTREEAKQVFLSRGYVEVEGGTIYDANKWRESCRVISEWLEQEPKTEWIPVSERLPEEWKSVLVCYKSQGGIAQCVSERLITMDGSNRWSALGGQEPIAWMPLPHPYESQESEDKG